MCLLLKNASNPLYSLLVPLALDFSSECQYEEMKTS